MTRTGEAFQKGRKALIVYLTVGYPSLEATLAAVPRLEEAGCDLVELGIPFSDPLADGATIQHASYQALKAGVTPRRCLELAAELRLQVKVPLVFMTYYNPVLAYGLEPFCHAACEAGVGGLIVPDLPPDEGAPLEQTAAGHNLDIIYLLAPTSTPERIALVSARSRGFIYLVSLTGVTGARQALPRELEDFVGRVRKQARLPLAVGFGIGNPAQAQRAARVADGVIVGSRLVQLLEEGLLQAVAFVRELRAALDDQSLRRR